jgi:hypothetical protein
MSRPSSLYREGGVLPPGANLIGAAVPSRRFYEAGEFNFFKERRDNQVRDAANEKNNYFGGPEQEIRRLLDPFPYWSAAFRALRLCLGACDKRGGSRTSGSLRTFVDTFMTS